MTMTIIVTFTAICLSLVAVQRQHSTQQGQGLGAGPYWEARLVAIVARRRKQSEGLKDAIKGA